MAKNYFGITLHGTMLLYYTYTLYKFQQMHHGKSVEDEIDPPEALAVLRKHQYSFWTLWGFIAQITFLVVAVIEEILKILHFRDSIIKTVNGWRSYLFSVIVFPTAITTATAFWLIYSFNREWILPAAIDRYFPIWMNHAMHSMVVVPVIIELFLPKKYNFISYKRILRDYTIYCLVYTSLYVSVYLFDNIWLYPGFALLTWGQKLLLLLSLLVYTEIVGCIGVYLLNLKKPARREELKKKK